MYPYFIFVVCITDNHIIDPTNQVCVCAEDYYETAAATEDAPPVCTTCPPGSTTSGNTNSIACGKYGKMIILISGYLTSLQ